MSVKHQFYRQCRIWHGYLSALAFAALLFFAVTGILLNHPDWVSAEEPQSPPVKLSLTDSQRQEIGRAQEPARLLTEMLAKQTTLYGEYEDGYADRDQISVRLRGSRGSSSVRANLRNGEVTVVSARATTAGLLNALHRGEHAGAAWRMLIDVAAGILIVLSLVGYAIFFSMTSKRFRTGLALTAASMLGIVVLFIALVR